MQTKSNKKGEAQGWKVEQALSKDEANVEEEVSGGEEGEDDEGEGKGQ